MLSFSSYSYRKDKRANCENFLTKRWYFSPWKTAPVSSHGFPFRLSYYFLRLPVFTESYTFTNSLTSSSLHSPNWHAAQSSFSIFTSSRHFTSDVSMLASYRRVVKGSWPISFSFQEYFSLRTWTQLFSFHKRNLSPFTVYTLGVKAASFAESSVTKSRQNFLCQKTWVFNLVTLTTFYVLLTVHLCTIGVKNQLDAILVCLFHFSTCFEQHSFHHQENQLCQYIIWYISLCVGDRLICRSERTCVPDGHLHKVICTRWCIDTIDSPDDEHCVARNM